RDEGDYHAKDGHDSRSSANFEDVAGPCLEPDCEEKKNHSHLCQRFKDIRRLHNVKNCWSDYHPGNYFADNRRLAEPLEELGSELGRQQDEKKREQDLPARRG